MEYSDNDWKEIIPHTPPEYDKTSYNVVFDQHSHTIFSDGALTIKQNVEWHIAMGYNALAITDHNNMRHLEKVDEVRKEYAKINFIILSGIELTTNRIHLNFLGVSHWDTKISYRTTEDRIIDAINKAHDQGAIVVCDHIPWSLNEFNMKNHPSRETLLEWGVDYIEIINDDSKPENVYDRESYDFCLKNKNKIGMITGTDMHTPDRLVSGGVHGWTLLNLKELTEDALMEELQRKNTNIIYSKTPYLDPGIH
ncbi:MAG: PHP domain-containing protein [Promethearchaeota archaeon]|jgi:predicted metal-dependent phosphoesterase TrpH